MRSLLLILALLSYFIVSTGAELSKANIFENLVALSSYQTLNGGFQLSSSQGSTVQATNYATFLSSLYGINDHLNKDNLYSYLDNAIKSQHLHLDAIYRSTTVDYIRDTILIFSQLGQSLPNSEAIVQYILSLYDEETGYFYAQGGTSLSSIHSTFCALDILRLLSALNHPQVISISAKIRSQLQSLVIQLASTNDASLSTLFFSNLSTNSSIQDYPSQSYFDHIDAIHLASIVGLNFGQDIKPWVLYFSIRQSPTGGFSPQPSGIPSSKATSLAIDALAILAEHYQLQLSSILQHKENFDQSQLASYLIQLAISSSLSFDLQHLYYSHHSLARIGHIFNHFKSSFAFQNETGQVNHIIQGSHFTPLLWINSPLGSLVDNLQVKAHAYDSQSEKVQSIDLFWRPEINYYSSDHLINSETLFGHLRLHYQINVPGQYPPLGYELENEISIGYDIQVISNVISKDAGKVVDLGDIFSTNEVSVLSNDAHFKFNVHLSTLSSPNIQSGPFDLIFNVLDSSNTLIHQEAIHGDQNKKALIFQFDLDVQPLLPGDLICQFLIQDHSIVGDSLKQIHSQKQYHVRIDNSLAATHVQAVGKSGQKVEFLLGTTAEVIIYPTVLHKSMKWPLDQNKEQLKKCQLKSSKVDEKYYAPNSERRFLMDFYRGQTLVRSILGQVVIDDNVVGYRFIVSFPPNLNSIGTFQVQFRYAPVHGETIALNQIHFDPSMKISDSSINHLDFFVDCQLEVVDFQHLPLTDHFFHYGESIDFSFGLRDLKTNLMLKESDQISDASISSSTTKANNQIHLNIAQVNSLKDKLQLDQMDHRLVRRIKVIENKDRFRARVILGLNTIRQYAILMLTLDQPSQFSPLILLDGRQPSKFKPFLHPIQLEQVIDIHHQLVNLSPPDSKVAVINFILHISSDEKPLEDTRLIAVISTQDLNHGQMVILQPLSIVKYSSQHQVNTNNTYYSLSLNVPNEVSSSHYRLEIYPDVEDEAARVTIDELEKIRPVLSLKVNFPFKTRSIIFRIHSFLSLFSFALFCMFSHRKWKIESI